MAKAERYQLENASLQDILKMILSKKVTTSPNRPLIKPKIFHIFVAKLY